MLPRSFFQNRRGFSILEVLVAILILSLAMAGIFASFSGQQQSHLSTTQTVEMQQTARGTLYLMAKEIRMAGYDPDEQMSAGIISAGDGSDINNALTFSYVINDGADSSGELRTISFYLYDAYSDGDGNDGIGRAIDGSVQPLADNIETLQFRYLDRNGNATNQVNAIRAVEIQITARVDQGRIDWTLGEDTRINRTATTIVNCRNLGL